MVMMMMMCMFVFKSSWFLKVISHVRRAILYGSFLLQICLWLGGWLSECDKDISS